MPVKNAFKFSRQEILHLYKDDSGYSLRVNDVFEEKTTSSDPYFNLIKNFVIKRFGTHYIIFTSYLDLITELSNKNIYLQIKDVRRDNLIFLLEY